MRKNTLALAMTAALGYTGTTLATPAVEVGGVIEIEATRGDESSDIAVATAEVGLLAAINERVAAEVILLHEAGEADPITVDVATVTLGFNDNFSVTAGQSYAPFGVFESAMISDPLTLELAETSASLAQANMTYGALTTSLYTFNGANASDEEIDNWGINIGYEADNYHLTLGYIDNLGDSDTIAAKTIDTPVPGMSISAGLRFGAFSVIGEHIAAGDEFQAGDGNDDYSFSQAAQPSASNLELAYTRGVTTLAVGFQRSDEAEALGLAEKRTLASISHAFMPATLIALEYARDQDYAGEESTMLTAQLAVEF